MTSPWKYELMDLSNTHNSVADWLIANPGKGQMGACAVHFGYTPSWLSTLVHQDAFQALLKIKQGDVFEEVIIPLHEKMSGVAHRSVEKMGEILETTNDHRLIKEIGKDMLSALGYGASRAGPSTIINNTQNNLTVNADELAAARQRQSKHYGRDGESLIESDNAAPQDSPLRLSSGEEVEVGEASELRAGLVNSGTAVQGDTEEGGEV